MVMSSHKENLQEQKKKKEKKRVKEIVKGKKEEINCLFATDILSGKTGR